MVHSTDRHPHANEVRPTPDISADEITDDASLRDDYDLDSMDSFNLASAIHKRLGVNIPETDFARLQSLAQLVAYLEKHPA